jgi:hypothetical protein
VTPDAGRPVRRNPSPAVFEFESDKDDAAARGLRKSGELVREIVGCQGLMARYAQLALPEFQSDPELVALLMGKEAAWGGTAVMERFNLLDNPQPLVTRAKPGDPYEVKLTKTMRAQTLKLQAKFAELLDRKNAETVPGRHPATEAMLLRLVLTARALRDENGAGIDLEQELANTGFKVPEHWTCRRINRLSESPKGEVRP